MYAQDGDRFFVVDGHIHFWDASPENRNKYGEGPRARLRFDARVVADAIAAFDRRQAPAGSPGNRVGGRRKMRLIQFERID